MDLLNSILQTPLITRLGWTLLHSLWQIAIVSAILVIALRAMRSRDPRWRYSASCVALLTSLILPAITIALITNNTPVSSSPLAASRFNPPTTPMISNSPDRPNAHQNISIPPVSKLTIAFPTISPPPPSPTKTFTTNLLPTARATLPWLVLTWALGVLALSIWNLGGWLTLHQLRSRSTASVPIGAQRAAQRLCVRFNLSRPVRLLQSTLATTPLVLGAFRPIILLPASVLTDLSIAELESILAHELAHVRRHDYLVNLIQSVVETLLFYHPAIWWMSRQIRIEREHCCDDLALTVTRDRATYVTALAAVASVRVPRLAPAASGGKLLPRLRRVLGIPDTESSRSSHWLAGALVTACFAIAAIAPHLHSTASAADKTPPATQPSSNDIVHVRGRVLDPDGKPAAGAKVTAAPAWPRGTERDHPAVIARTIAGSDGRFQLTFNKSAASAFTLGYGQPGADLWQKTQIVATANGVGLDWQAFDHVDAAGDVNLNLVQDLPINGRLVDLEGRPVSAVAITVEGMASAILTTAQFKRPPENYRGIGSPLAAIEKNDPISSDADGRFSIPGLGKERRVSLSFYSDKVAINGQWVMTREGKNFVKPIGPGDRDAVMKLLASTFELVMPPARSVTGVVPDAQTHQPLADARVETFYSRVQAKTVTDAQGRFVLKGLERGQNTELRFDLPDQPYIPMISKAPEQTGAQPAVCDVDLFKGVWVSGKITDKDNGVAIPVEVDYRPLATNQVATKIPVFRQGWATPPCNTQSAPDGTYRLVVAPGPGILAVRTAGFDYALGQGFDAVKTKDANGRIRTLLPENVSGSLYNSVREIDAGPDGPTTGIDFALDRGNVIHITCKDPDGKTAGKIDVVGNMASLTSSYPSNFSDGRFDAIGFTKDETRLIVIRDNERHLAKIATVRMADAPDGKLTIKLEPAGKVTGRLLDPQGDPIKAGKLRIDTYIPELKRANRSGIVGERSDENGRFTLYLPPDIRYVLGASSSPYGGMFKWVTDNLVVTPGATKDLGDIALSEKDMMK